MAASGDRRLETPRLVLLPWSDNHLDEFARICADSDVMRYISHGKPLSRGEVEKLTQRSHAIWRELGFGPWAAIEKSSGHWVGRIGFNVLEGWPGADRYEVGWELAPEFWGRGLATEGARRAIRFGWERTSLERIISVTVPEHTASRRVMEKCGLTFQGEIDRNGTTVVWYAIPPGRQRIDSGAVEATSLSRTPLYARHVSLGARMVPFAGYEMPVQYAGVIEEHRSVRTDCGAFDVSHMGDLHVDGPTAHAFLQEMLSNDLDRVSDGEAQYTLLTNEQGGIVDDLIVLRRAHGQYLVVCNASNRRAVSEWLKEREPRGCEVRDASDEYGLVAVQGPQTFERLRFDEKRPFTHELGELDGIEVMVSRTGYTGEKGVELCCAEDDAEGLWDAVLARGAVPCGLGARDTLRLEVCYPLHGNDITPETDAISAGLGWACALETDFTGVQALRRIKEAGPARRLVPFVMEEKAVPRQGMAIEGGGEVTSGTHSPMLDRGIGMGYVPAESAAADTELVIDVRGKRRHARVVTKPIYRKEQ